MLQFIINSLLIFLTLSFPYFTFAQSENLVPNSSFERYNELPNDVAQGPKCISNWIFPNIEGTGEYYHANCETRKAGTKKIFLGSKFHTREKPM